MQQYSPYRVTERRAAGLAKCKNPVTVVLQPGRQQPQLRCFSGPLRPFENNKTSGRHGTVQLRLMMELVAPFFIPSMIQLFTWYMTLSKFSCAEIARW